MKEYIVEVSDYRICQKYIVLAKDAKDAVNQVYVKESEVADKEDMHANSIGSLHSKEGKIIKIY